MKTMKWLMMCMLAISACCLSACGDDDESIRLTPTDENQQPISSDYTLQLSPFSEGESYYIYGAETPFTIENSNKEVVEVIEGNSTLTFKPLLQGESIISIRDAKSHVYFLKIKVAYPSRSFHVIGLRGEVIGDEITQKEERELSERILKSMPVSLDGEYFFSATWADAAGSWAEASDPRDRGTYTIYVQNNTTWETALNCYAWADGLSDTDILGAWPGSEGVGTLVVGETTYYIYDVAETLEGATLNLIINNNGTNTQIPDYQYTVDGDCWFAVDDTSASEIEPLF